MRRKIIFRVKKLEEFGSVVKDTVLIDEEWTTLSLKLMPRNYKYIRKILCLSTIIITYHMFGKINFDIKSAFLIF